MESLDIILEQTQMLYRKKEQLYYKKKNEESAHSIYVKKMSQRDLSDDKNTLDTFTRHSAVTTCNQIKQ